MASGSASAMETRESSWREAAEFIFDFFAPRLFEKVGDAASIVLRPCANGRLLIDMTVRCGSAESVEAAIGELAREFIATSEPRRKRSDSRSDT